MKFNIKYIAAVAALTLGGAMFTSCDDYLDVHPDSSFNPEEIFSSEKETKAMMATIYSAMGDGNLYGFAWPYTFDTNTDVEMRSNGSEKSSDGNGADVNVYDAQPHWGSLKSTWNKAYSAINYCNDFIENVQDSKLFEKTNEQLESPTEMQHMYGEVRCLRALIYFDLMRTFGDVVFRTSTSVSASNMYSTPVTDRDVIYEWLINDLKDAEHYMMYANKLTDGVTRASREFCQGLIGQLALYRGGWSLRDGGSKGIMQRRADYLEDYKTAKEYFGKIITEGKHSLDVESFEDLWTNQMNFTVLNNGDVIFEVPLQKDNSGNIGYQVGIKMEYDADQPGANKFGGSSNRATFCGLFPFTYDMRDLRFDITCVPYKYDKDMNQVWDISTGVAGWGCGKWNKSKMSEKNILAGYQGSTGIDNIRLRYADVLLMYAEVCNELNEPNAAKEAIKTVRKRAFAPELWQECVETYVNNLSGHDAIFNAIKNERAWELAGEGVRKYDLARWGIYGKTIKETYEGLKHWGELSYQDADARGIVRDFFYYRKIEDPVTKQITLEIKGIKEYGKAIGEHPYSEGWAYNPSYARNWYSLNTTTGEWEYHNDIKWSFRGFINWDNQDAVSETDVLRYLMPYPTDIITQHRGSIHQMYGY